MRKNTQQTKFDIKDYVTYGFSVSAIAISIVSLVISLMPEDTQLTIKTTKLEKCYNNEKCYKVFIYNNDKAPCFEFKLDFEKTDFKQVSYQKDYKQSSIFNASYDGRVISFPSMNPVPVVDNWLGYLDKKQIAYFLFFHKKDNPEIKISCIDYEKSINLGN